MSCIGCREGSGVAEDEDMSSNDVSTFTTIARQVWYNGDVVERSFQNLAGQSSGVASDLVDVG